MRRKPDQPVKRSYVRKKDKALVETKSQELVFLEQMQQTQDDICLMFEAGAQIEDLSRKFPLFTPEEILALIQGRYSVDKLDFELLDGMFLKQFQRQMGRLDGFINDTSDPELKLKGIDLLIGTIERTVKYKHLLAAPPKPGDLVETASVTITIQQRIENKLTELPPPDRPLLIEVIKASTRERVEEILDAEWSEIKPTLLLTEPRPSGEAVSTTPSKEVEDEDEKEDFDFSL